MQAFNIVISAVEFIKHRIFPNVDVDRKKYSSEY